MSKNTSIFTDVDEIKQKLSLYDRINTNDVKNLQLGTRISYIEVLDNGTYKYKLGGVIIANNAPQYLVLTNNGKSWSVQLDKHIIFKEQYHAVIKEYTDKIKKLEKIIKQREDTIRKLFNKKS